MKYTVHLLVGLPGSGKTYFSNTFNKNNTYIIELDENQDIDFLYGYRYNISRYYNVCIDGLLLTVDSIEYAIKNIMKTLSNKNVEIIIHYWHENRENCKENDEYRIHMLGIRKVSSAITIESADFVSYNEILSLRSTYPNIKIVDHEVYKLSENDKVMNKYTKFDDDGNKIIRSKDWCNGGTWGDWRGNHGIVESEEKPEFTELDNILTELCPNITFLQYKKIMNDCVTIKTWTECDYYGGETENSYYECNVNDLMELLNQMNII